MFKIIIGIHTQYFYWYSNRQQSSILYDSSNFIKRLTINNFNENQLINRPYSCNINWLGV